MSFGEQYAPACQRINVWRFDLRVSLQASDPVVEIIDGDEENIGALIRCDRVEAND